MGAVGAEGVYSCLLSAAVARWICCSWLELQLRRLDCSSVEWWLRLLSNFPAGCPFGGYRWLLLVAGYAGWLVLLLVLVLLRLGRCGFRNRPGDPEVVREVPSVRSGG